MSRFEDDEPVVLDCGCTCSDGEYYISNCQIWNREKEQWDTVTISCCSDDGECLATALETKLNFRRYLSTTIEYVKTANEKECELADIECDEMRGK